jgi:hypothetical protein
MVTLSNADDAFLLLPTAADVSRAMAVLDRAWAILRDSIPSAHQARDRERLTYIVASCALTTNDPDTLFVTVLKRFRQMRGYGAS